MRYYLVPSIFFQVSKYLIDAIFLKSSRNWFDFSPLRFTKIGGRVSPPEIK
jgi:hypothetical protein